MRMFIAGAAVAAAAFVSTGAAAQQQQGDLARENRLWQIVRANDMRAFSAMLDPNFVAVYAGAVNNKQQEVAALRAQRLRSFAISGFQSRPLAPNVELVTYRVTAAGRFRGTNISGIYNATSVWKRNGRSWQLAYHGEVKAQ